MNRQKNYIEIVNEHKDLLGYAKKLELNNCIMQFSLFLFAVAWRKLEYPFYNLGTSVVFAWCIYMFINDFFTSLKLDVYGSQLILDGIVTEREEKLPSKYFHEALKNTHFSKILLTRSIVNFLAFGCFGYLLCLFVVEFNHEFNPNYALIGVLAMLLTILIGIFYYASLRQIRMQNIKIKLINNKD